MSQNHYYLEDSCDNPANIIAANHIIKETVYSFKKTDQFKDSTLSGVGIYDQYGNITVFKKTLNSKKEIYIIDSSFYNEQHRLIKMTSYTSGFPDPWIILTVNFNNNLKNTSSVFWAKSLTKLTIDTSYKQYDSTGRLSEEWGTMDNNQYNFRRKYYYGNDNRMVRREEFGSKGNLDRLIIYEYKDKKYKRLAHITQNGKKEVCEYIYSKQGQYLRINWGNFAFQYTYNLDGTLFEYRHYYK